MTQGDADTLRTAARMLAAGADADNVLEFVYQIGRVAGLLEAGKTMLLTNLPTASMVAS